LFFSSEAASRVGERYLSKGYVSVHIFVGCETLAESDSLQSLVDHQNTLLKNAEYRLPLLTPSLKLVL